MHTYIYIYRWRWGEIAKTRPIAAACIVFLFDHCFGLITTTVSSYTRLSKIQDGITYARFADI